MKLPFYIRPIHLILLITAAFNTLNFGRVSNLNCAYALTWEEAKLTQTKTSFKIETEFQNIEIARNELGMAQSQLYPAVSFRAGAERFLQENATLGYRAFLGPRLTWAMYQGGQIRNNVKQSKLNISKKERSLDFSEVEEEAKLRQLFANAVFAKKNLELAEISLQRSIVNNRYVRLKYNGGQEYSWVFQTSQKSIAENEANLLKAHQNAKQALSSLQQTLGEDALNSLEDVNETGFAIKSELLTLDIETYLEKHPKYLMAQNDLDMAQINHKISKGRTKPDLLFRTDFIVADTDDEQIFPFWYAGVTLSFPIFEAGFYKKNIKISRLKSKQMESSLQQFKKVQFEKIDQQYMSYQLALKNKEVAQLNLEAVQNKYKLYQRQYRDGLINYPLWDAAQKDLRDAENLLINNIRAIQVEYGQLLLALGVTEDEI